MKSSITASMKFYFKGQAITPRIVLDLDLCMGRSGELPNLYDELAANNGIGTYSYEYEMMLGEEIQFGDAKGLAEDFLRDGVFDAEGFKKAWQESKVVDVLAGIAREEMGATDLQQQPQLKNALLKAFYTGKKSA